MTFPVEYVKSHRHTVQQLFPALHAPLPCTTLLARGYVHYWKRRSNTTVNASLWLIAGSHVSQSANSVTLRFLKL